MHPDDNQQMDRGLERIYMITASHGRKLIYLQAFLLIEWTLYRNINTVSWHGTWNSASNRAESGSKYRDQTNIPLRHKDAARRGEHLFTIHLIIHRPEAVLSFDTLGLRDYHRYSSRYPFQHFPERQSSGRNVLPSVRHAASA